VRSQIKPSFSVHVEIVRGSGLCHGTTEEASSNVLAMILQNGNDSAETTVVEEVWPTKNLFWQYLSNPC